MLLALSVVLVWGTNFVVIKWGLGEFPPFLFSALRFVFSALPWVFFIPRPAVSWARLAAAGTLLSAGQFGLLYWAMVHDVSPAMASILIQAQAFFTIILAMLLAGERLRPRQVVALLLAASGFAVAGWHAAGDAGGAITIFGLGLILSAAFCWACANTLARGAGPVNMLAFTVWSSLYGVPPVLLVSALVEGPSEVWQALAQADLYGWLAAIWQGVGNTTFAFGIWNWLLSRYPAATVAPLALLVPVFGMVSSAWLMAEPLPGWKQLTAALVLGGLIVNLYAGRLIALLKRVVA